MATLNLGHFVITHGGHHLMLGSWEGIRRQRERGNIFCLLIKMKKAASGLGQNVILTTPDASCLEKKICLLLMRWHGGGWDISSARIGLLSGQPDASWRSQTQPLAPVYNGSRMLARSGGIGLQVTKHEKISVSQKGTCFYIQNKPKSLMLFQDGSKLNWSAIKF